MFSNISRNSRHLINLSQRIVTVSQACSVSTKNVSVDAEKPAVTLESELKKNSDTFGNYAVLRSKFDQMKDDPEDIKELKRQRKAERMSPPFYINIIKTHLDNHAYDKALEVLEERMLKIDRVKPDSYIYDLLISYNGRRGDVKEAFRLYNEMKKRGYPITGGQYTSLFNACSNSLHTQKALEVADKVRGSLAKDELHNANIKNYNAMIKAFGRHGDLKTCLEIMDEVLERRGRVLDDTYNFLLQACVTDSNSGFRHALLIWHKLLVNKTDPSVYSFNLMLRAVRDCNIGDLDQFPQLLEQIHKEAVKRSLRKITLTNPKAYYLEPPDTKICDGRVVPPMDGPAQESPDKVREGSGTIAESDGIETVKSSQLENKRKPIEMEATTLSKEEVQQLPNLLAVQPKLEFVFNSELLSSFVTPYHRLMLLGGATGFLKVMASVRVKPDIKTFTLLLQIIPSTVQAEEDLMKIIRMEKIKFDVGFFNALIKKRSFRQDFTAGKDVLRLMQLEGIAPDLLTFGALALMCVRREDGEQLIQDVKTAGLRVNSAILGPLVRKATYADDMRYIKLILDVMKEDNVEPSPKLMALLNNFKSKKQYLLNNNSQS